VQAWGSCIPKAICIDFYSQYCGYGRGKVNPLSRMLGRVFSIGGPFGCQPSRESFPASAFISALIRLLVSRAQPLLFDNSRRNEARLSFSHGLDRWVLAGVLDKTADQGLGDMSPGVRVARGVEESIVGRDTLLHWFPDCRQDLLEEGVGSRHHVVNVNLTLDRLV